MSQDTLTHTYTPWYEMFTQTAPVWAGGVHRANDIHRAGGEHRAEPAPPPPAADEAWVTEAVFDLYNR